MSKEGTCAKDILHHHPAAVERSLKRHTLLARDVLDKTLEENGDCGRFREVVILRLLV